MIGNDHIRDAFRHHFKSKKNQWLTLAVLCLIVLLLIIYINYPQKKQNAHPAISVVTSHVTRQDIPVYLVALGTVTPLDSVTVKTQVNGQLQQVYFKEGQMVKKGTVLAQIDERPLLAQLKQYQGQLERDQALLANARIDLCRYEKLFSEDSVSQQTLETQRWLVKQYEGDVKTDEGLIQSVKVNLIYARITSPVNGRVGLRLVDPGNFVQTSDTTGLFVLNTLQPITVVFTLPEDDIQEVMTQINAGKSLIAKAYNRSQTNLLAIGKLLAVDNQVDTTTGTIKIKAVFTNEDNILFPNQFVNIHLLVNTLKDALTVPTAAVLHGSHGDFVYALQDDHHVKVIPVKTGVTYGDVIVIKSGLKLSDNVIVEGTDKLADGAKVKVWQPPTGLKKNESV